MKFTSVGLVIVAAAPTVLGGSTLQVKSSASYIGRVNVPTEVNKYYLCGGKPSTDGKGWQQVYVVENPSDVICYKSGGKPAAATFTAGRSLKKTSGWAGINEYFAVVVEGAQSTFPRTLVGAHKDKNGMYEVQIETEKTTKIGQYTYGEGEPGLKARTKFVIPFGRPSAKVAASSAEGFSAPANSWHTKVYKYYAEDEGALFACPDTSVKTKRWKAMFGPSGAMPATGCIGFNVIGNLDDCGNKADGDLPGCDPKKGRIVTKAPIINKLKGPLDDDAEALDGTDDDSRWSGLDDDSFNNRASESRPVTSGGRTDGGNSDWINDSINQREPDDEVDAINRHKNMMDAAQALHNLRTKNGKAGKNAW